MRKLESSLLVWICGCLASAIAVAQSVEEAPLGQSVERHLSSDEPVTEWVQDPALFKKEAGDHFEVQDVAGEALETVKLTNVIPAIHFESGVAEIPPGDVELLRKVLEGVQQRRNVRLHLVGHADDQPLSPALARRYTDNAGLSRERAGEVAEFLQRALELPPDAITYEWAGDTRPIAPNTTPEGRAQNRRVEVEVWYDEPKERMAQQEVLVAQDFKRVKVCRVETLCKLRFKEGQGRRARVKNLVPALHYADETPEVSADFIEHIRKALDNLSNKQNVVVKFIGYTDDTPLTDRDARIYGDQVAFSKAKALRVALAVQEALKLPSAAIASDGRGASQPLAGNDTAQGRALNRRVEVQFWHDDPLQELPDEPQLCPANDGTEVVTRVYDPPWGSIAPLELQSGQPIIPAGYAEQLRRAMADIHDKAHVRLRFLGYTANERLDRRTAAIYGDDVGLSAARAGRAMEAIRQQMNLTPEQVEHEGRGYVHSADVVNTGFTQDETSQVVVQVVYDEPAPLDDYEGVDITRLTRELSPKNALGLNLMHISVDGQPLDDPDRSSSDVQRCTDVALEKADIQFQFDNLSSRPRLSVTAPASAAFYPYEDGLLGQPVRFSAYANYWSFIDRAEVRIFAAGQSVTDKPLAIVAVSASGLAEWQPLVPRSAGAGHELQYVLRAYGKDGQFDDTRVQSLAMTIHDASGLPDELKNALDAQADSAEVEVATSSVSHEAEQFAVEDGENGVSSYFGDAPQRELIADRELGTTTYFGSDEATPEWERPLSAPEGDLLAGYGENALAFQNIRLGSGTVKVHGSNIPPEHTVWVAGRQVPVDASGNFIAEALLPSGQHTVEVAVLDEAGNGSLYLRDLEFEPKDRFYVGIADVTYSHTSTSGPAELLQGENPSYDFDSTLDGRLAFYLTEKLADHWHVTASADTREGPVKDLFSNFLDKSPDSLFRRMDPDYHVPTFGDDSVVEELAPTMGKLYLKVSHDESHALWGNFKVGYADNELTQVDRGLYGGNAYWQSEATTNFGEQRVAVDAFAAQPGTVASREEFRGTGGSLYFLHNQDILTGSESVRIELRDKDSGLVTGVVNLRPVLDYDIDYLQGRVLLAEPLNSTEDDNQLIHSSGVSGQEAFLVVRYEYTPGFTDINAMNTGGQGHYWINDYIKVGLTASSNEEGNTDSSLRGADLTLRKSANSWVKIQGGRSAGAVSSALLSSDGGFNFAGQDPLAFTDANADGYRADVSVGFDDFFAANGARLTLYTQELDAGYSAPGFANLTDSEQYGGTLLLPFGDRVQVSAKADKKVQDLGLETSAQELDVGFHMTDHWSVSTGVRKDVREDNSLIVPLTQEQGERTDAVVQVGFDSLASWRTYAFVQDTVSKTESREDNGRMGVGSSYQFGERLRMNMEVSDGDFGPGGRLGTNYQLSDETNLYLNYGLENERTDNGLRTRRGNLISGVKQRLSDSSSMYIEERYQDTNQMSGLTHATGVNLTANNRWNFGANMEIGTLVDDLTGAGTKRKAGGIRVGYGLGSVQFSSGIEYMYDDAEQLDTTRTERTTWLLRNNFKYQVTPDWRLVGKLNYAQSESSEGQFYDGGYTEAVIGFGYRPVASDRLTALAKYTYFYNVPTTDQVTPQSIAAQFIQKSYIASLDLTYDMTQNWSVGGKYAYRRGAVSLERVDPQFLDNAAHLVIVRTDFRVGEYWEGMLEGRMLDLTDLDEQRAGALVGVYRYVGEHVKAGVGYNFTNFSEDLTDLSFTHQGVFINVSGSM
ncbi:MAG TPA: OmpA family protein [Steroidobacteraceae bacterium]|nr:OmpA family protein [Steroidobacteraceae bacterium]